MCSLHVTSIIRLVTQTTTPQRSTGFVQVGMPVEAWLVLEGIAVDTGRSKADVLRQMFPAERHAQRVTAQKFVADQINAGASVTEALRLAGLGRGVFENWKARDAAFREMLK